MRPTSQLRPSQIRLTHTDLKPENVLLVHPETKLVEWPRGQGEKVPAGMLRLLCGVLKNKWTMDYGPGVAEKKLVRSYFQPCAL